MADPGFCLRSTVLGLAALIVTPYPMSRLWELSEGQKNTALRMDQFVSSRDFSGAVLVARDGHVLFQRAYGMANREHEVCG